MLNKIINIYNNYKEVINYLVFGFLTTVVNLATKYLLLFTILNASNALHLQIAIIISWIAGVLFAYITNRIFVFESKNKNKLKEFISFVIARIATLLLEMIVMWFFVTLLKLNSKLYVIIFTLISAYSIFIFV